MDFAASDKHPTKDPKVVELREAFEYDSDNWRSIRDEAKKDMQFVSGNPWTTDDDAQRKNRPTVAPEEMSQYRNQVINALMANPRGGKFAPVGNGANDKGAEFYQNKWREVEYRSNATLAYIQAADNALQRSYGFVRVKVDYASPRTVNQDISVEGFPNPDMVLPDSDALRYDSGDMKRCFVYRWIAQREFKKDYPKAKVTNFGDFTGTTYKRFIQGDKVLLAEYWSIKTRPRKLLLVQATGPQGQSAQLQAFDDELDQIRQQAPSAQVVKELRTVDYPDVTMCLSNGLEILHEQPWAGKYIPIVSCYGKVLYVEGDTGMERKMMSMTRFGRDPWKSYCYACSQELEVLAMVPKAPLMIPRGSMNSTELKAVAESMHVPKAYLTYEDYDAQGRQRNAPQRADYIQASYLEAIEVVKEGYRRAIQAAMGSNFLPTQAQKRNEKSGKALDKIDQVAAQGTYHFVYAYDGLIKQAAIIGEDLMDKIHDYTGDVGVIMPDGKASQVRINDAADPKAISTKGDYLVTVSSGPSSDSEREAAADFTESLIGNLQMVEAVAGPKVAAAVLARAIRMRNLGPMGDAIADLIEPPEFKQKDGEPPNPQMMAAQAQIQQLTHQLQKAGQIIETKQVEQQGKLQIAQLQTQATSSDKAADREVKLAVAEIAAQAKQAIADMALFYEERARLGSQQHEHVEGTRDRMHEDIQNAKDRLHERIAADAAHANAMEQGAQAHDHALEQGDQAATNTMAAQQQAADLAPQPEGAGA